MAAAGTSRERWGTVVDKGQLGKVSTGQRRNMAGDANVH